MSPHTPSDPSSTPRPTEFPELEGFFRRLEEAAPGVGHPTQPQPIQPAPRWRAESDPDYTNPYDAVAGEALEWAGARVDGVTARINHAVDRVEDAVGIPPDTVPDVGRRGFLIGAGATAAALLFGIRQTRPDRTGAPLPETSPHTSGEREVLRPRIAMRPRPELFGDADVSEAEQTDAEYLRRIAPVFTVVHTVGQGETISGLARRYYAPSASIDADETLGWGIRAIAAANGLSDETELSQGTELYVPISEPVVIASKGKSLADIATEWGFSVESLRAVNADNAEGTDDYVFLPVQQMPTLADDERLYLVEHAEDGHMMTYYSIAQELGTGLSTLIGRNKPVPTHLEYGHILVASHPDASGDTTTTTTAATTTTSPTTTTTPGSEPAPTPGNEDGVTPEDLIGERDWSGEIVRTTESDQLEQDITIERLEEVVLTREGYETWVKTIDKTTFLTVFEKANTLHPDGVLDSPDYFIIHHTAQGVEPGVTGMERLTGSIAGAGLSVQWAITHEETNGSSKAYQLVSNPKLACNHAYGVNDRSTGVELVTDSTRAQGSVTTEQLTEALYLAYFVGTNIYERDMADSVDFVRGHREVNDLLGVGTAGKPDFFADAMVQFRAKLLAFAQDMA